MIEYFFADPPAKLSTDQMWLEEIDSIAEFCVGNGVDLGAGRRTIRPDVRRVDINPEHEPDIVADVTLRLPFEADEFDFVFAGHVLEHCKSPREVLAEWLRVVKPGGHVCLVLPDTRYTLAQNTDPTPHIYEWAPREFAAQVLDWEDFTVSWFRAVFPVEYLNADVVQFTEACPSWSFCVVLRKRVNQ